MIHNAESKSKPTQDSVLDLVFKLIKQLCWFYTNKMNTNTFTDIKIVFKVSSILMMPTLLPKDFGYLEQFQYRKVFEFNLLR